MSSALAKIESAHKSKIGASTPLATQKHKSAKQNEQVTTMPATPPVALANTKPSPQDKPAKQNEQATTMPATPSVAPASTKPSHQDKPDTTMPPTPPEKEDHVLITYTCYHFSIIPLPYDPEYDFSCLPYSNLPGLQMLKPSSHIALPTHCGDEDCESLSLLDSNRCARVTFTEVKMYLEYYRDQYIKIAEAWFKVGSLHKARLANDPECALALKQFGIEKKSWKDDRFFWSYRRLKAYVEQISQCLDGDSFTPRIVGKINNARALIPGMDAQILKLIAGKDKACKHFEASNFTDKPKVFWTGRRDCRRNKINVVNKNALRCRLMEHAMLKAFWKRMQSFREDCNGKVCEDVARGKWYWTTPVEFRVDERD